MVKPRRKRRRSRRTNVIYTSDSQAEPDFDGFETEDFTSEDEHIPLKLVTRVMRKKKRKREKKRGASNDAAPCGPQTPQPGTSQMSTEEGKFVNEK